MPSSYYQNIPVIMDIITELNPRSVLDIGPGNGKYGFLIREYLDNFNKPRLTIDAVEIYPEYKTDIISLAYDMVWYGDWTSDFIEKRNYDLVLMIDVIEHWTKNDALEAINKAMNWGKHVLISTPQGFLKQGPRNGNSHEEHLSGWKPGEIKGKDYSNSLSIIKVI